MSVTSGNGGSSARPAGVAPAGPASAGMAPMEPAAAGIAPAGPPSAGSGCPDAASASASIAATPLAGASSRPARLVLIGGLPGTGKSTLAVRLGEALGAVVLRSEEVRRQLARFSPASQSPISLGQGMYSSEMTEHTYGELLSRARVALADGQTVVADASWHDPVWREAARKMASETSAGLTELHCELPLELIAERVTGQATAAGAAAAATLSLVRLLAASEHPWPSAIPVDTAPDPSKVAETVLTVLESGD